MRKRIAIYTILTVGIILSMTAIVFGGNDPILDDGLYSITPKCAPGMSLDIYGASMGNGANLQIYKDESLYTHKKNQRFYLIYMGNNYYAMIAEHSGKAIDVKNGSGKSGANVQQYDYNLTNAQMWKITSAGNDYYYFSPRTNENLCLDVYGGWRKSGTNVWVYTKNYSDAQKFKLQQVKYNQADHDMKGSKISGVLDIGSVNRPRTVNISNTTNRNSTVNVNVLGVHATAPYTRASQKITVEIVSTDRSKNYLKTISKKSISTSKVSIKVDKSYKSYTVYISSYNYGNGILGRTLSGGGSWTKGLAQVQIDNGSIVSYN